MHDRQCGSAQQICSDAREVPLMNRRTRLIVGGVAAAAVIGAGTAIAVASVGGDDDEPLTGTTLDQAVAAALEETGGGTVTETEIGDDGAAYSVEVRREDGSQVEVNLDQNFNVIGQAADDDGADDQDGDDDD
jgi:Peptidase propeptide and YPEB domain